MVPQSVLVRDVQQDLPHGIDVVLLDSEAQASMSRHGHGTTLRCPAKPQSHEFEELLRDAMQRASRDGAVVVVNHNIELPEGWGTYVSIFADKADGVAWRMLELPSSY